ncbi:MULTISPECIES: transposase [unclassified Mesorhizobium]|uniref:transposase n=1 Tax=unclassified Mesorhizobium TaxID=325217 RepID=UPI0003CE1E85|nr:MULTISPECIES: transposase [unclassified Mesorhizobium]ESY12742.1 hypothetical protein X751_29485 [Mesorhizobium sp. LNJC395A00]WJI74743.1 transposase [Mesorhizobium sp. C395A]
MIAYDEDGNDANRPPYDRLFKMAWDALPSVRDLTSQSTRWRPKKLPGVRELVAVGRAVVDLWVGAEADRARHDTLVHEDQQLRLFNAHYDEYQFQPIGVFDDAGRFVGALLRPAKRAEIAPSVPPGAGDPEQLPGSCPARW